MREIETEVIGGDERAGLLHMRAKNITQRRVHQVRRGMVAHGVGTVGSVGDGHHAVTDA
jgi:hypothetical protein